MRQGLAVATLLVPAVLAGTGCSGSAPAPSTVTDGTTSSSPGSAPAPPSSSPSGGTAGATGSSGPPSTATTTPLAASFQVRPVLAVDPTSGPCATWTVPPRRPGWFCDRDATRRYRLGPAGLTGTDVAASDYGRPSGSTSWVVLLTLDPAGSRKLRDLTGAVVAQQPPRNQVAFVMTGTVLSAPVVETRIRGGQLQMTGDFTRAEAQQLAAQLVS